MSAGRGNMPFCFGSREIVLPETHWPHAPTSTPPRSNPSRALSAAAPALVRQLQAVTEGSGGDSHTSEPLLPGSIVIKARRTIPAVVLFAFACGGPRISRQAATAVIESAPAFKVAKI